MNIALCSFSERGAALAERLAAALGGEAARCGGALSLRAWTAQNFAARDALVFVGAAGIAVRAIAPLVQDKATDPAVVAVDETGTFAIPLLSGHLGGANDLARRIGALCGAEPVITTATDRRGVFAVDEWARRQNCAVVNKAAIKTVSARLLAGERVRVRCPWPIDGAPPALVEQVSEGAAEVCVDVRAPRDAEETALCLAPRVFTLGVGCRRGAAAENIEAAFQALFHASGIWPQAVCGAASIDAKADEPGLREFCARHGWTCRFFSAAQLRAARGEFAASDFVEQAVGVDNVCERAAVLGSGGTLFWGKQKSAGVTMALAMAPWRPDWRWQRDENGE